VKLGVVHKTTDEMKELEVWGNLKNF